MRSIVPRAAGEGSRHTGISSANRDSQPVESFQAKLKPVRVKKTRQIRIESRSDPVGTGPGGDGMRKRPRIFPFRALSGPPSSPINAPTTGAAAPTLAPSGEVAEWLNAPHSKCGIGASLSGVRIPPSPPVRSPIRHFLDLQEFLGNSASGLPECRSVYSVLRSWIARKAVTERRATIASLARYGCHGQTARNQIEISTTSLL